MFVKFRVELRPSTALHRHISPRLEPFAANDRTHLRAGRPAERPIEMFAKETARIAVAGRTDATKSVTARRQGGRNSSQKHAGRSAVRVRANKSNAGKGEYYVGKGKYIKDDRGLVSKSGRDSLFTGGFAGGEKGLWSYRDELVEDKEAKAAVQKKEKKRRETKEVSLAKDFGGLAGGFPGGEVGVKSFNATGELPETKPATLGWGPPVLGTLAVVCGYTYYTTGELTQESLLQTAETLTTKASEIDTSAVAGDASVVAGAVGQVYDLLPQEVKDVGNDAALAAFAVLFGALALRIAISQLTKVLGKSIKIIGLGAVSTAIALKILDII